MNLIWEEELQPSKYDGDDNLVWRVEHHLKRVLVPTDRLGTVREYKVSLAWVTKVDMRKWRCAFINNHDNDKTFRSLKAAKAYALAIVTLDT